MAKILVVDDELGVRITLQDRLESLGHNIDLASDGLSGEKLARSQKYDLILLDLMMPGKGGLDVCHSLRTDEILTPIIMLTAKSSNMDTVMGLKIGADDYIGKPFDMGVLLARVENQLRRQKQSAAQQTVDKSNEEELLFGSFCIDTKRCIFKQGDQVIELHNKEWQLLLYLATHPEELLDRNQLLDAVWGYDCNTSTRTVDVHIARLRQLLGESSHPHHIQTIRGQGYRFFPKGQI